MGVPALFRWLSQKYPKIISPVIEERPVKLDNDEEIPVDTTGPNPNGEELDNLYLDMNGIVHPCSHPDDKPAPSTEGEMMLEIFKYTERVVNMVRPRKLLMIAVDGVAPRAKMNQQRARRFRAVQEAKEKDEEKQKFIEMFKSQNEGALPEEFLEQQASKKTWDSNAITPGTPFMDTLASSLRYWCAYKLNTDPAWAKMKVIISDASVPGEGEHKIMEFIRSQRGTPNHDPNTRHVIYGLDADLIMLGLATHEPHFRVLREDVFAQEAKARTCKICGQTGHKAEECRGQAKKKQGEFDEKGTPADQKPFIWLHVSILREYLAAELEVVNQGFPFDLEKALDDWVFMCFFVGNDFLPHLPSLEIRENGIDTLIAIWRDNLKLMGGYVTCDGTVNLDRAQIILEGLAKQEQTIFKRRQENEERMQRNQKERAAKRQRSDSQRGDRRPAKQKRFSADSLALDADSIPRVDVSTLRNTSRDHKFNGEGSPTGGQVTYASVMNKASIEDVNQANRSAAAVLKEKLANKKEADPTATAAEQNSENNDPNPFSVLGKRTASQAEYENGEASQETNPVTPSQSQQPANDEPPPDTVRLWEEGYEERYYEKKFGVDPSDVEFRHKVARAYAEGLAWVLLYYFQGCASWTWYYPYHYAPFAADFVNLGEMKIDFNLGKPFKPFEQLMGVLPRASRRSIPEVFHPLMDEGSEIDDFYPEDFPVDLNGKKFAWQGVVILPFIDEHRLLEAMGKKYPLLSAEDHARNEKGNEVLLFSDKHPMYENVLENFYSKRATGAPSFVLNARLSEGLSGSVQKNEDYIPGSGLSFPGEKGSMPDLDDDHSLSLVYHLPPSQGVHKSMILRGVNFKQPVLTQDEIRETRERAGRTGRSHGGVPFGNGGHRGGGRGGRGHHRGGGGFNYTSDRAHNQPYGGLPPPPPPGSHINPDNPLAAQLASMFPNGFPQPPVPPPPGAYGSAPFPGAGFPQMPGGGQFPPMPPLPPGFAGMPPMPPAPPPQYNGNYGRGGEQNGHGHHHHNGHGRGGYGGRGRGGGRY